VTPRYPTDKRYRRRNKKSPIIVILLGLTAGGGGYVLFGDNTSQPVAAAPVPVETQALAVVAEKDKKVSESGNRKNKKAQETAKKKDKKDKKEEERIDKKEHGTVDLTTDLEEKNQNLSLKVSDAIVLPTRGDVSSQPVGKKIPETGKKAPEIVENPTPVDAPEVAERAQDLPPLPRDLTPKVKPPDVELTFYDALTSRKVVLPHDVPREHATGSPAQAHGQAASTANRTVTSVKPQSPEAQTTPPTSPVVPVTGSAKNYKDLSKLIENSFQGKTTNTSQANGSGSYMVQLAVFSNLERANQMVSQLQRKGRVAHMVHSEGASGPVYRVRTGPFPSFADAKSAIEALPTDGQAPVIIKPQTH